MDVATIDQQFEQLQSQAQETINELKGLAAKLQGASQSGNTDAREWLLDLKSIALAIQAEQNQVGLLLQALHGFVANQGQQLAAQQSASPWGQAAQQAPQPYPQQPYPPQPGYAPAGYGGSPMGSAGGLLGNFLNSGFGRAIEMGAGFGIGNDLINKIF